MRLQTNRSLLPGSALLATCALAAGCSSRTYIVANGSTPPQYTHLFITTQSVWLNPSATAGPDDGGWVQNALTNPVTIDLVTAANGTLVQIVGDLKLTPGTYNQILLVPVPYTSALTTSAASAGATFNQEVDYVDSTGQLHQVPLLIPNPDKGITVPGSVKVPFGSFGAGGIAAGLGAASGTDTTGLGTSTSTSSFGASSNTTDVTFALNFNGATDITLFTYGTDQTVGAIFNPHATASDLTAVGGISGNLAVTTPNGYTNPSARLNITATAQTLSADGTRHVPVLSAPVAADGSFLLYPLYAGTDTSNPTTYDVVIHGAGIATMVIKSVQVTRSTSSTSSVSSTTTTSTSSIMTATANTSLGTLTPITAGSYTATLTAPAGQTALPAGAAVGFYQTLPASNEVPYLIEEAAVDPVNHTLVLPQPLSTGMVESATFSNTTTSTSSSLTGATLTLTSAVPAEGAGVYRVGGLATLYGSSDLGTRVSPPATADTTAAAVTVTPPGLPVQAGAAADALTAAVTLGTTPGEFNAGVLLVTQGGTLIASAPLDPVLAAGGGAVTINGVPGGIPAATHYYLSALVWNTNTPGSLSLQSFPGAIDLSEGSVTNAQITIN